MRNHIMSHIDHRIHLNAYIENHLIIHSLHEGRPLPNHPHHYLPLLLPPLLNITGELLVDDLRVEGSLLRVEDRPWLLVAAFGCFSHWWPIKPPLAVNPNHSEILQFQCYFLNFLMLLNVHDFGGHDVLKLIRVLCALSILIIRILWLGFP